MSNFGIDIDDVIFRTSDELKKKFEECDDEDILQHKLEIIRGDIVNPKVGLFLKENAIPSIISAEPMQNVAETFDKLREQSNKIILITARGNIRFPGSEEITFRRLKEHGINYDGIVFNSNDKVKVCKDNNIDIFIDDSPKHCLEVSENLGIPVIGFESVINREEMQKNNIRCIRSWDELDNALEAISQKRCLQLK